MDENGSICEILGGKWKIGQLPQYWPLVPIKAYVKCTKMHDYHVHNNRIITKYGQSRNDGNQKNDSKYHISAYNYNTRMEFRAHKNILGEVD